MAVEMRRALEAAATDDAVRVLVVHGEGDSFCAGADLNVFLADQPRRDRGAAPGRRVAPALPGLPQTLIAAVHGQAVGMGVTMLPHFDMVYAGDDASF